MSSYDRVMGQISAILNNIVFTVVLRSQALGAVSEASGFTSSKFENTPGHLGDSHFPKGISAGLSFWKIGTRQMCMK